MAVSREIKVGSFVLAGLVGAGAIIFLIGDNRALFDSKVHYHAQFDDVQGVKPGSTVRMGGVDIGTVSRVEYSADKSKSDIEVDLSIVKREADRIREGSMASIAAKGLLGDKMVTVTPGSPDQPPIPPGGLIHSAPNEDFTQALGKVQELAGSAKNVMQNLELATGTLADAQLREDVRRGVAALSNVLVSLDSGPGYAAKLLHDPKEAERVSALLSNLDQASARLDRVLAGVDDVVGQIKRGPGFAHEVLYGADGSRALAQVGSAAEEVGKTLAGVREGNSLAHGLLYGTNGQGDSALGEQVAGDLSSMSSDLRTILDGLREGKGTLGALLVDPSVYEDMKMLLGNVQRNQALRALVRYSIKRDDGNPGVEVVDPKASDPKGAAAAGQPSQRESSAGGTTEKSRSAKAASR